MNASCHAYECVVSPMDNSCHAVLSCRSFVAKEPLIIGLFRGKWPIKIRHPMTLRQWIFKCTSHTHTSTHSFFLSFVYTISDLMCRFFILFVSQTCYAIVCQCQWLEQSSWLVLDFVWRASWKREVCMNSPDELHFWQIAQSWYITNLLRDCVVAIIILLYTCLSFSLACSWLLTRAWLSFFLWCWNPNSITQGPRDCPGPLPTYLRRWTR